MAINNSQNAVLAPELSVPITTAPVLIGTLIASPVIIIFDNQSTAAVAISPDGVTTWHTFPAGEAISLDMRANHGIASNFTFDQGMSFFGAGTTGSGNFSISYVYAQNS